MINNLYPQKITNRINNLILINTDQGVGGIEDTLKVFRNQDFIEIGLVKNILFRDGKTAARIISENDNYKIEIGDFVELISNSKDTLEILPFPKYNNNVFSNEIESDEISKTKNNILTIENITSGGMYLECSISNGGFLVGMEIQLSRICIGGFIPLGWDNYSNLPVPDNITYLTFPFEWLEYLYTEVCGGTAGYGIKFGLRPNNRLSINYLFGKAYLPTKVDKYYSPVTGIIWWTYHADLENPEDDSENYQGFDVVYRLNDHWGLKIGWLSLFDSSFWIGTTWGFTLKSTKNGISID